MEKKTILIANTHKEQVGFLKKDLEKNNINIEIIDAETNNSEEMKEAIIKYKPYIVLTNELKKDKPATDIIKEIQDDVTKFQPIFIIHSGYPTYDIERTCCQKGIHAYSYFILDKDIDLAIKYDISLTMVSVAYLKLLDHLIDKGQILKVHIKLDTGMHRIGLMSKDELSTLLELIDPNKFDVEGIFTHFATADGDDEAFEKQRNLFYEMIGNCKFKYIHCCNSAAMTYHHDEKSNMGRLGITMYGCSPNGEEETKFKQVMSLYTKVAMIKKIPAGDKVGYGLTYTAKEDEYIATLPIGYADGLIRKNQGRKVYINGKYYEIVGRVCMDQMMVRVDKNVKIGDQVEIFGEHISLESMAKDLDTISYEVLCLISKRVPRVYVQNGQVKELL